MDTTEQPPCILSLCSGYGGIERGLGRVFNKVSTIAHVEIEAFAIANLVNKMETGQMVPAPIWTDIKTFNATFFRGMVDILTAGYPCQPFSTSGKRLGEDDPRHLWPHVKRIIRDCQPTWIFLENVEGHISKGLPQVIVDLEEMAYTVECGVFSAAEVGAPHQRKRVFVLAYSGGTRPRDSVKQTGRETGSKILRQGNGSECSIRLDPTSANEMAYSYSKRPQRTGYSRPERRVQSAAHATKWPARPGEPQHPWEEPRQIKPQLGGKSHGSAHRLDRLRLLGNGVVPQTAEKAFVTLFQKIIERRTSWKTRRPSQT